MKRKFLKFDPRQTKYAPRMQSRRLRIGLSRSNVAYKSDGGEGGEGGTTTEKTEAEAIAEISKQVDSFVTLLGTAAKADEVAALKLKLENLEKNVSTMQA